MKNLPLKILHFALDTLYEIKLWCYAIINKAVPVAPRDDYSKSKDGKWYIEFSAPAEIQRRRKKLLGFGEKLIIPVLATVLGGLILRFI